MRRKVSIFKVKELWKTFKFISTVSTLLVDRIMATTGEGSGLQDSQLFKELESYPWDSDEEFQAGLVGILGPNPVPDQVESLTLHARCFYYSRQASYL